MELQVKEGPLAVSIPISEQDEAILRKVDPFSLPYASKLCFTPLIRRIEKLAEQGDPGERYLAGEVLQRLEAAPELRHPIEDLTLLEKHKELVHLLLLFIAPPVLRDQQFFKLSVPFRMESFYLSPALERLIRDHNVEYTIGRGDDMLYCATLVRACSYILNRFYDQKLDIDPPLLLSVRTSPEALPRYYKTQMNFDFLEVVARKPLQPLSQEQIDRLLSNIYDTDLWLRHLPPENFEFHGFMFGNLVDITEDEALSRLKHNLLKRDGILGTDNVLQLEELLRIYFNLPDLRLGIMAIDYPKEATVAHQYKIRFDFLNNEIGDLLDDRYAGSIYERVCRYREVLLVEDLRRLRRKTPLEEKLIAQGLRSIIVAPLIDQDERIIGLVELGSANPYELHSFIEIKFKEIIELFRTAVGRSRDEIDNRVEAIIREQYTALHPSVEWRFIEAAFNVLERRERGERTAAEPITFHDVYPLYGQSDIVNSSLQRNQAIRLDLIRNLELVQSVLRRTQKLVPFPLVSHVLLKIVNDLATLGSDDFNSSDETRIVDFLQTDVHPLLRQLRQEYAELGPMIDRYFAALDSELNVIYDKRKAYEESVNMLNHTLAMFLDEQDEEMQRVLPHYFEKYKTDGVEYEIYVGQSLLQKKKFSLIHLRNIRLWQLIHMCQITRVVEDLRERLPVPLTTAQLIFAYTSPLSIHFRLDEKQFDVDGAYNVRYEILKKRIDKAMVEDGRERLTQAGKIAIVYLQDKDRQEYLDFLHYLHQEGYITGEIEDLRLDPVQGVQGLRALRVEVVLK